MTKDTELIATGNEDNWPLFREQALHNAVRPDGTPWFDYFLDREIASGRSCFVGIFGRSQGGKSTLGLQTMIRHDPNFSWDRVTYNGRDFLEQAKVEPPEGSYFLIDDAGAQMPANRWWDIRAQVFDFAEQVLGMYHWVIIITVPLDRDIISKVRGKFDVVIRVDKHKKGEAIVRLPEESQNMTRPYTLYPYPRFALDGEKKTLRGIRFGPLDDGLFAYYQERKKRPEVRKYIDEWLRMYNAADKGAGTKPENKRANAGIATRFRPRSVVRIDPEADPKTALTELYQRKQPS